MTRIFYDTEFLEDGRTIELISIGMVAEDGRELYLVAGDGRAICRAVEDDWLCEHVVPSLPALLTGESPPRFWKWDPGHPDYLAVNRRDTIAASVREFILAEPDPQLWADWCAYDHVALCQLWGTMIGLPEGVPMWTHEFRQLVEQAGNPDLPSLPGAREHNALDDARELKMRYEWLASREGQR